MGADRRKADAFLKAVEDLDLDGFLRTTCSPPTAARYRLDPDHLQRLAWTFNAIGDEIGGARYPAVAFVQSALNALAREAQEVRGWASG